MRYRSGEYRDGRGDLGYGVWRVPVREHFARWNVSQFSSPFSGVLPASARLIVFTPISARELLCGLATEQRRWCTPQLVRKVLVTVAVNSGPPSVVMSS